MDGWGSMGREGWDERLPVSELGQHPVWEGCSNWLLQMEAILLHSFQPFPFLIVLLDMVTALCWEWGGKGDKC